MTNKIKLNGGFPKIAQILFPLIFAPIFCFLIILIIKKPVLVSFAFAIPIIVIQSVILKNIFKYADIYIEDNYIIVYKLFSKKKIEISDCIDVKDSLIPFTFYLMFNNNKSVYFFSNYSDLWRQISSSNPNNFILELRERLKKA